MHRLFTIVSVLSLLIAVVATAFWIRGNWGCDRFGIIRFTPETATTVKNIEFVLVNEKPSDGFEMAFVRGGGFDSQNLGSRHLGWNLKHIRIGGPYLITGFFGFAFSHRQMSFTTGWGAAETYSVTLPHYFVVAVALIFPAFWLYRFRRERKKARSNCCMVCGYDLRASKDTCPECGTAIVTTASQSGE